MQKIDVFRSWCLIHWSHLRHPTACHFWFIRWVVNFCVKFVCAILQCVFLGYLFVKGLTSDDSQARVRVLGFGQSQDHLHTWYSCQQTGSQSRVNTKSHKAAPAQKLVNVTQKVTPVYPFQCYSHGRCYIIGHSIL